jgi:transposase
MAKHFLPYDLNQTYLLPPDLRDWVPSEHLIWFVSDVVDTLDLSAIYREYEKADARGRAGYHPGMLVKLLVYAYCVGKPSSRKIEKATWEEVAFRVLSGDQHPDHDSIADFRKRHLSALAGLFVQVLLLCRKAGLVKLGHVALDGTKVKANASKHKAMSYERMCEAEQRLQREVAELLREAERVDEEEDGQYGKGRRGDELPAELAFRESRLKKIQEAKAALEQEAKEKAAAEAEQAKRRLREREEEERKRGCRFGGRKPDVPVPEEAKPEPTAQRNFTDPESRIMVDGATKGFVQGYNAQAAVDEKSQVIVAAAVTQQTNDKLQFVPMLEQVRKNLGVLPAKASADSGYFSEGNVTTAEVKGVDCYIPPEKHVQKQAIAKSMRDKLDSEQGRTVYRMRKAIVEPVFGQIKDGRGFRRFSFRGLTKVAAEWDLICLTHNLLKLFRAGMCPIPA